MRTWNPLVDRARVWPMLLLAAVVGCSTGDSKPDDVQALVHSYTVDGILTQLPTEPGHELMIRHVSIPDFVNASGDTVGMNAMTMGFPLADAAILDGFAAGDTIRFVFEVRWGGQSPLRLTGMQHLPPGTELDFAKLPTH